MSYELDTIEDVRRRITDCPQDLKLLVSEGGLFYPIKKIESCYVKPSKDWASDNCFTKCEKDDEGAIQVMGLS